MTMRKIKQALLSAKVDTLIIDDAGYLMTNAFMIGQATKKRQRCL